MAKTRPPYSPEFRRRMVEPVREPAPHRRCHSRRQLCALTAQALATGASGRVHRKSQQSDPLRRLMR
jgi:hypothetical protein